MPWVDWLLGRPLATEQENQQRISAWTGIPTFGLDALGSAAYGPEAALTVLLPAAAAGLAYILPLSLIILALLAIVFFSYRQTIEAYPNGGGSYTVASQNLGQNWGLFAAAALMLDYVLDVGVGISTGVGALISARPSLASHTLAICLGVLVILTLVNLRGVRESGFIFTLPTYLFIFCLLLIIALGLVYAVHSGGHPQPRVHPPAPPRATAALGAWLLIRSFAGGCTALTGVEAVSNGVLSFREPRVRTARITLTVVVVLLACFQAGIAYLTRAYGIVATQPGTPQYQSLLSMLTAAVVGRGAFYFVTMGSILIVLSLSANTAFAGFPQLCRAIAEDGYLPRFFALRGRRLEYTEGILSLSLFAAIVLIVFGGVTDRLIPLFAIGAFLAFTFSQAGMVLHWRRQGGGSHSTWYSLINGTGALATGITVVIVLVAKFVEGAWATLIVIPLLVALMRAVHRHYARVNKEITIGTLDLSPLPHPIAIVPVGEWNCASQDAMRFACSLTTDVRVIHIECTEEAGEQPSSGWQTQLEQSADAAGIPAPRLIPIQSPFRFVTGPIVQYVLQAEAEDPRQRVVVVVPELVAPRWYQAILHRPRAAILKTLLRAQGSRQTAILSVPWHLRT